MSTEMDILLMDLIPHIPNGWLETFLMLGVILGTILMVYSVFIEQEYRSDILRLLGAGGLMMYALYIENIFFTIAMAAIAIASAVEFIEIFLGLHKHSPEDLKRYKHMWRIQKK